MQIRPLLLDYTDGSGALQLAPGKSGPFMVCVGGDEAAVNCQVQFFEDGYRLKPELRPGVVARGNLVLDNTPLAGARVALIPHGLMARRAFTLPLLRNNRGRIVRELRSDKAGRFLTPQLAPGAYRIEVALPGGRIVHTEPFSVPAPRELRRNEDENTWGPHVLELGEFVFDPGAAVEVNVVDLSGAPLAGIGVGAHQGEATESTFFETSTNGDGLARLSGLDPLLPISVTCVGKGYLRTRREYDVPPPFHDCVLEPLAAVNGRVLDPENRGIAGAVISGAGDSATSGADGRFVLASLAAGAYELEIVAQGYRVEEIAVELSPGERGILDPVYLLPGEIWTGVVRDRGTQEPIVGAAIGALRPPGALSAMSGEDGTFTATSDPDRTVELEVSAEGYPSRRFQVSSTDLSKDAPIVLELERGGQIRVIYWDEEGQSPCQGCPVSIQGGGLAKEVRTNGQGVALSQTLPRGRYLVSPVETRSTGSIRYVRGGHDNKWVAVRTGEITTIQLGKQRTDLRVNFSPAVPRGWTLEVNSPTASRHYAPMPEGGFLIKRESQEPLALTLSRKEPRGSVRVADVLPHEEDTELYLPLPTTHLSGTVRDANGPIGHCEIRVVGLDQAPAAQTLTTEDGVFSVPFLHPGSYSLLVEGVPVRSLFLSSGQILDLGEVTPWRSQRDANRLLPRAASRGLVSRNRPSV